MNTVQISTVKVTSDVEVIFVNSKFVIKAMRAAQAIDRANSRMSDPDVNMADYFLKELIDALEYNAEELVQVKG